MCDDKYINFLVGERGYVEGYALPKTAGETVVIASATYEITKEYSDEVIMSGDCEFDGNSFGVLVSFEEPGNYVLTASLSIGKEEPKEKAYICVSR